MAFDPKTGKVFLTVAEVEETPAAASQRPQRRIKPESFAALVVSK